MSVFNAVRADIATYLATNYDIALDSIGPESTLEDAGFDSLGVLAVATMLENKYGISLDAGRMTELRTFADLMELVRARSAEAS